MRTKLRFPKRIKKSVAEQTMESVGVLLAL